MARSDKQYAPTVGAIILKISKQVPPNSPEATLMFAVFASAARDLTLIESSTAEKLQKDSARKYFSCKEIVHLSVIGIETDWVKGLFKKAGVEFLLEGSMT